MQNLPFFVGEWALQHNRPLLPLSRAKSHENFCLWNPESWGLESGKHPKESGILLTTGIQHSSSTEKYGNPVPGIQNPQRGFQNPRLP